MVLRKNYIYIDGNAWVQKAPYSGEKWIRSLCVYNGKLYGGTSENGKLYEWNGTDAWVVKAPKLGAETNIISLCVYNGKLYGGTQQSGKLYEWNGVNAWVEKAPQLGGEMFIYSLCVYYGYRSISDHMQYPSPSLNSLNITPVAKLSIVYKSQKIDLFCISRRGKYSIKLS